MSIKLRHPIDEDERDWAFDDDRWFHQKDEHYVGASSSDVLIADVSGICCVIKIEAPDFDGEPINQIKDFLLKRCTDSE